MWDEYYAEDWAWIKKSQKQKTLKKVQNHKRSIQIKDYSSRQNQVTMPRINKDDVSI